VLVTRERVRSHLKRCPNPAVGARLLRLMADLEHDDSCGSTHETRD
jgi:hypothetical protein